MSSLSDYLKWNALRRRSLRLALGLHRVFPTEIINKLIGDFDEKETFTRMQEIQEERIANYIIYLKDKGIIQEFNLYHKEYWIDVPLIERNNRLLKIIQEQKIKQSFKQQKAYRKLSKLERMEQQWIKTRRILSQQNPFEESFYLLRGNKNYQKIKQYEQKQHDNNMQSVGEGRDKMWNKNAIRRIPCYNFFKLFGFNHLVCKEHNTHLTYVHILDRHCPNLIQHVKILWEYLWDESKETLKYYKKKGDI